MYKKNEKRSKTIIAIKDKIFIDNGLLNDFWAKKMKMFNYLHNILLTKSRNHGKLVPKVT